MNNYRMLKAFLFSFFWPLALGLGDSPSVMRPVVVSDIKNRAWSCSYSPLFCSWAALMQCSVTTQRLPGSRTYKGSLPPSTLKPIDYTSKSWLCIIVWSSVGTGGNLMLAMQTSLNHSHLASRRVRRSWLMCWVSVISLILKWYSSAATTVAMSSFLFPKDLL